MSKTTLGARVLLIGCGQLGSRHLQAVATLSHVAEIEVIDPRPEALALGQERLAEVAGRDPAMTVRWFSSLEQAKPAGDLCIVATQAEGRCQLVKEIADQHDYPRFLIEKVVSQSVAEYEELIAYTKRRGLAIWVNCKTRAYPIHERIKPQLDPSEPLLMSVVGGNHGLANNGIHAADLFAFYDGCEQIGLAGAWIDPVLHPSKRGPGVFDLSGTLCGVTAKGSQLSLSYARDHQQSDTMMIVSRRYRCLIDHLQRWAVESHPGTHWEWQPMPFEGNLLVSAMTKRFVTELLTTGRCALPTLEQAAAAHRFILGALHEPFARLLERELASCPVT